MKYILYGHGGSGNHGCEAIVRSTLKMLPPGSQAEVYTSVLRRDKQYGITDLADFRQTRMGQTSRARFKLCRDFFRLTRNADPLNRFTLSEALKARGCVCLSVGGDNYCNGEPERHSSRNKLFAKHNKTVLWGCSITPELLKNPKIVEDMKRYALITARESLTYNALHDAGVENARLVPDPAFTLEPEETELPPLFSERKVVGINISPLVMKYQQGENILMKNMEALLEYILSETEYGVALIPHVLLLTNNDLKPLRLLYEKYKDSGRVCLIDEDESLNCCQLKYVISRCAFMAAARTHASIAAYSTCVPTLVLGYSVKSRGIATDLFGTDEHYVLPVDTITGEDQVKTAFQWLLEHEEEIRAHYREIMPGYIERAREAAEYLKAVK